MSDACMPHMHVPAPQGGTRHATPLTWVRAIGSQPQYSQVKARPVPWATEAAGGCMHQQHACTCLEHPGTRMPTCVSIAGDQHTGSPQLSGFTQRTVRGLTLTCPSTVTPSRYARSHDPFMNPVPGAGACLNRETLITGTHPPRHRALQQGSDVRHSTLRKTCRNSPRRASPPFLSRRP